MRHRKFLIGIFFIFVILSAGFISSYISSNVQYSQYTTQPSETLNKEVCQEGQDFLIQISPFGCTPAVVRTDLLEENDVPVYCQLGATKINPLIDVKAIDSISFSGTYPKEIAGLGFHPAKAALGVKGDLNSPVLNNIGYVVLILKKQANASAIPDFVSGTLTAKIKYNINNAFGIGNAMFYLPQLTDEEWKTKQYQYSFWGGRGSLRVENIEANSADISLYSNDMKISEVSLEKGKTSNSISLPGFTCQAGLKLRLDGLENPDTRAKLRVNAEVVEVAKGEKFLDNKCQVQNINKYGLVQKVGLKCQEDTGSKNFDLTVSPKVILYVDGVDKEVGLGDWLYDTTDGQKGVYLGYIGTKGDSSKAKDLYVYLFSTPQKGTLSEDTISSISSLIGLYDAKATSTGLISLSSVGIKNVAGAIALLSRFLFNGEALFGRLSAGIRDQNYNAWGKDVFLVGFAGAQDIELTGTALENYQNAKNDYDSILESYSSEKFTKDTTSTFGEEALYNEIILSWDASQKKTAQELCNKFEQNYPRSNKILSSYCDNAYQSSNTGTSGVYAMINKQTRQISFDGIYEPSFEEYGVRVMVTTPSGGTRYFDLTKNRIQYLGDNTLEEGKEIFTLPGGTVTSGFWTSDLYFTYASTGWLWSADKEYWMDVTKTKVEGGKWDKQEVPFSSLNRVTVDSLVGKNYDSGKTILTSKGAITSQLASTVTTSVSNDYIQLVSLEDNSAGIKTSLSAIGVMSQIQKDFSSDVVKLTLDSTKTLGEGYAFTLSKINLKKVAKVSVIPNIDNSGTQANFSFKIGIEKRAIDLPPEKVKQMVKDLDGEIKQWNDISTNLNGVVEGLKTSCIVTGAALVATNFIANAGGTGIARKTIMRGTDGWYEKCADLVARGTYSSQEQCFNENSDKIDNDVEKLSLIINTQNSQIKQLESGVTTQQFLTDSVVDTDAFMQKYAPQVSSSLNSLPGDSINDLSGKGGQPINKNEIVSTISYEEYKKGTYNTEQLRNIELYTKILSDSSSSAELKDIANSRLYSELSNINVNIKTSRLASSFDEQLKNKGFNEIGSTNSYGNERAIKGVYDGGIVKGNQLQGLEADKSYPVKSITYNNKKYILVLENSGGNNYFIKKVYDGETLQPLPLIEEGMIKMAFSGFQKFDSSSYNNPYKNAKLRYYETDPYKGLPAIVPFDLNNGWYAATKQTLSTGGNIQSFDASARVNSFYLCNVGSNGLEEFQTIGDDNCEMINTGTGQSYNQFPGLSESEAKSQINKAVKAIEQASKMYKSGLSGKVKILDANVDVGSPAVNTPQYECQDFMSPKDCLLLFNLCDPVICPSSRCDLGGAYPVKDVVQSGIIGSLVLCLPNINEGIIMPVCLSGIKAGIDGFVSVKQAYKDCLQESLDTGKLVGICDEIYSIYMCDFFWRQALPLADMVIPKVMEMVSGQNVKGGGEYLSVSSAWSGAEQAINYFVNNYGVNAKESFIKRSTEAVKGEVCKSFVSGVTLSGGDLLNTLSKSDSPVQFNGRFDEISLTTVTAPPTSHYKVFYHIYAGKDSGAYYQVYLKGSLDSSYYKDTAQSISVASGYVAVGGYASETKDFVATSGYNQLCINVNGQEECGFKEVSTSFAVNYIKDEYLKSQAIQTDIKTESECISGTASAYSLLNPNVQSAAEGIANPELYNAGIIRVCATGNPGSTTDSYAGTDKARWKEVGYCDNEKLKCWIDTQSVENVIKTTTVEGETLNAVTKNYVDVLSNENGYLTKEQFSSAIKEIESTTDSSTKITLVGNILNKSFWSNEKVQLLYLRGNAYGEIFRVLFGQMPKPEATTITPTTTTTTTGTTTITDSSELGQRVLDAAVKLEGTDASKSYLASQQNEAEEKISCWNGAYQVYKVAGVDVMCVYADPVGVKYTFKNKENTGDNKRDIIIGVTKRENGDLSFIPATCSLGPSNTNSQQKLDNIQPGYLLSMVVDGQWAHNVIFIKWIDKSKRSAQLFDWNGQATSAGSKTFQYLIRDISDDSHPIFTYWKPHIYGQSSSSSPSSSKSQDCSTTSSCQLPASVRKQILYEASTSLIGSEKTSLQFVIDAMLNAGVKGIPIASSVDSLIYSLEKDKNFAEIDLTSLEGGDIILLGNGCTKNSIGIFNYHLNNKFYYYVSVNGKVQAQSMDNIIGVRDNIYIYRAYRYIGDLSATEKASVKTRSRWTIDSAITEVNNLLKTPGKTNGGKYSDNKKFVDELIFDGILEGSQCNTMRGINTLFGLINTGQDMNWLKKVLLEKKASSGVQAESVD